MTFVAASIFQKAYALAQQEGLDKNSIGRELNAAYSTQESYIPMAQLLELYEWCDQHLDTEFALRQGQQLSSEDYGTLGMAWRTCWQLKDLLESTVRYMVLVTDAGSAEIHQNEDTTSIVLHRPPTRRGIEMANEATFVMLLNVMNEVSVNPVRPVSVEFQHQLISPDGFKTYFSCPVIDGQSNYVLKFKSSEINIPTKKADKSIHRFLVHRMEVEKSEIHQRADIILREISMLVEESLANGVPSIEQTAQYFGMSGRTLKRRLADRKMTFRELVQRIQKKVALSLIKDASSSIGEIAFQTGFSEQSAFNRAFKRWTGSSPLSYRKSQQA